MHCIDDLLPHAPLPLCSYWGYGQEFIIIKNILDISSSIHDIILIIMMFLIGSKNDYQNASTSETFSKSLNSKFFLGEHAPRPSRRQKISDPTLTAPLLKEL
jgi:hypothetical protein